MKTRIKNRYRKAFAAGEYSDIPESILERLKAESPAPKPKAKAKSKKKKDE